MTHILLISGSARTGSRNKLLLALAAQTLRATGAALETFDLRALDLPIVDEDVVPEPSAVDVLRRTIAGADGVVLASPEYNHSITPLLKNAIDWVSHPMERQPFRDKPVQLMSASARPWGGTRMLPHLRDVLVDLSAVVLPAMVAVPSGLQAFAPDGTLLDERVAAYMDRALSSFVCVVEQQASSKASKAAELAS